MPLDIGGSRADGTVIMGIQTVQNPSFYTYEIVDWVASENLVKERCVAWGFSSYTGFSGRRIQVVGNTLGLFGQTPIYEITRTYQCTTEDAIQ